MVQANERTFLAWIRTSLAMMTFGFVVARLGAWLQEIEDPGRESHTFFGTVLGAGFVILAVLADVLALARYRRALRALVAGGEVPQDAFPFLFGIVLAFLGGAVVAYVMMVLR